MVSSTCSGFSIIITITNTPQTQWIKLSIEFDLNKASIRACAYRNTNVKIQHSKRRSHYHINIPKLGFSAKCNYHRPFVHHCQHRNVKVSIKAQFQSLTRSKRTQTFLNSSKLSLLSLFRSASLKHCVAVTRASSSGGTPILVFVVSEVSYMTLKIEVM